MSEYKYDPELPFDDIMREYGLPPVSPEEKMRAKSTLQERVKETGDPFRWRHPLLTEAEVATICRAEVDRRRIVREQKIASQTLLRPAGPCPNTQDGRTLLRAAHGDGMVQA